MRVAAAVAREKEKHPERFCRTKHCLWRTHHADGTRKSFCRNHPEPKTVAEPIERGVDSASQAPPT